MKRLDRLDKALKWFLFNNYIVISLEKALKLNPVSSYLWKEKAKYLKRLNRHDETLEWFFSIILLFLSF